MGSKRDERLFAHSRFRPLSGSYISQEGLDRSYEGEGVSFRPLSGSYISQYYYDYQKAKAEIGFRPLSGSYISQSASGVLG